MIGELLERNKNEENKKYSIIHWHTGEPKEGGRNMKQEEKELLLKDLCARLPYGVKVHFKFEPDRGEMFESHGILESINNYSLVEIDSDKLCGQLLSLEYNEVKPYLFPLSSMTEEQEKEWRYTLSSDGNITYETVDWCNKNHFDYRGLIEKSLALDATGLNIYKEEGND